LLSKSSLCPPDGPLVWYVAYGSNLAARRFACYLSGGRPTGGARDYAGCRDTRSPRRTLALEVDGGLVFAGRSTVWGGGMAFYDPFASGRAACRAYLVTADQFADVVAQEMRRPAGGEFARTLAQALPGVKTMQVMGPGCYETVIRLGEQDGAPLLTVTVDASKRPPLAAPSLSYVRWVAAGLREAHGWSPAQVEAYLTSAPGARGAWTPERVAEIAAAAPLCRQPRRNGIGAWRA
jgi:hypothetical protein